MCALMPCHNDGYDLNIGSFVRCLRTTKKCINKANYFAVSKWCTCILIFTKITWNRRTHAGAVGDTNGDDIPPSVQDAITKMASGAPCMQ